MTQAECEMLVAGLEQLLAAVHADDPKRELLVRVGDLIREASACGEKRIQLTEQWSLRKLQLADRSEWALQYLGMDWFRLCEFLPSKNDASMDDDIRKFADSVRASTAGQREP
jgi:hypothetical protein